MSHIGGHFLCWAVICSCQTTFKPPFLMAKSTIKHHFGGRSGKGSTVPIQILWAGRSPSHRQLPYTVDGHGWHGCCHAGSRPAGGAGVRWTGGGATRESVPSVEGSPKKASRWFKVKYGWFSCWFFSRGQRTGKLVYNFHRTRVSSWGGSHWLISNASLSNTGVVLDPFMNCRAHPGRIQ